MSFLAKALSASSRAAAREGPKTATPVSASASVTPAASGASGPTTTRPIDSLRQNWASR